MPLVTKSTYLRGPKGDIGLQGPRGERGLSGAPGPQGPQGESSVPASSDDILEGFDNLFFTNERADARVTIGIDNLIASAPNSLDTLNELAIALNNDSNFGSTVVASLAGKLAIAGGTMTGALILNADPSTNLEAATKQYVDSATSNIVTSYNDLTDKPVLFSGSYIDLTNKPTIPSLAGYATENFVTTRGYLTSIGIISYNDLSNKPSLFSGSYIDLTNKPTLFSGDYNDLTNKPVPAQTDRLVNGSKQVVLQSNGYITLANGAQLYDYGSGAGNGYGITDSLGDTYIGYDPDDTGGALHMDAYNGKNIRIRTTLAGTGNYKDWLFDSAGNLTLPAGGDIKDSTGTSVLGSTSIPTFIISGLTAPGSAVVANETNVSINFSDGGSGKFVFKANGKLQLAAGGDIVDSTGTSVLGGSSFSGSYTDLTNKPTIPSDINQLDDVDGLLNSGGGSGASNWGNINFNGGDFDNVESDNYDNSEYILNGNEIDYPSIVTVPETSSSLGETGQIAYDNDYVYICIATNAWKRSALSSW